MLAGLRMFGLGLWIGGWLLLGVGAAEVIPGSSAATALRGGAGALKTAVAVPSDMTEELHAMSDASGVVFTGGVLSVRHVVGEGGGSGVVEVRFAVEQAVRGCVPGSVYTLREWAGLWEGGNERYRVGERYLMMLHAPGPGGLSSPVGGQDGAVPLLAETAGAGEQVDLRWIGTRVGRPLAYRHEGLAAGAAAVEAPVGGASFSVEVDGAGQGQMLPEVQRGPKDAVLMMLRGWQKERANGR